MLDSSTRSKMEILRRLKSEFDKLSKRNKSLVIIGVCVAAFFLLEILK